MEVQFNPSDRVCRPTSACVSAPAFVVGGPPWRFKFTHLSQTSPTCLALRRQFSVYLPKHYPNCDHKVRLPLTINNVQKEPVSNVSTSSTGTHSRLIHDDGRNPILGLVRDLLSRRFTSAGQHDRFGSVYKTNILLRDVIVIADIDMITHISRYPQTFSSSYAYPSAMSSVFGRDTILFLDGVKHKKQRTVLNIAFIPRVYNRIFEYMCESSLGMCEAIRTTENGLENEHVDAAVRAHFMRVITKMTVSDDGDDGLKTVMDIGRVVEAFQACASTIVAVPFGPAYEKGKEGRAFLNTMLKSMVLRILKTKQNSIEWLRDNDDIDDTSTANCPDLDKLDLLTIFVAMSTLPLIPNTAKVTDADFMEAHDAELNTLGDSILSLWFAGYFTTSASFISGLHELCENQGVLTRLRNEQDNMCDTLSDDTILTIGAVNHGMPLLDAFVSETLRLWPAVAFLNRRVTEDVHIGGYFIPKNSILHLDVLHAQRRDSYFADPLTFDLDRFLNVPRQEQRGHAQLLSFGAPGGAHYCVGAGVARLSLKVAFAKLIRKYNFSSDGGLMDKSALRDVTNREFVLTPEGCPKHGVNMTLFEKL